MKQRAQLEADASIAPKLVCLRQGQRADGPSREQAHRALRQAREPASITAHPRPIPAPRRPQRRRKRTILALERLLQLQDRGLATCPSTCLAWISAKQLRRRQAHSQGAHGNIWWTQAT